jgi:soluble lytic murein transglycosylase-like protein
LIDFRGISQVSEQAGKAVGPDGPAIPSKEAADNEKAREACKEFESIFIYQLLSSMRKAFKSDEESDSGFGGDIFKSMMDEQMSIAIAKGGGVGLADLLEKGLGLVKEAKQHAVSLTRISQRPKRNEDAERSRLKKVLRPYETTIRAAAQVFHVSPNLLRAVIIHESAGDPKAVSPKGAKGLMQLMDATANELGVTNPFDPTQNIFGGARMLGNLLKSFDGDLELALASYNAGQGAVRRYGGVPPYRETQEYIKKVSGTFLALSEGGSTPKR